MMEEQMTIGPLQIILIKLPDEQRTKPISEELMAVRKKGLIRLVDMIYVNRDMEGNLRSKELSDLTDVQKIDYGTILHGLLGMRAAAQTDADVDEVAKAFSLTQGDFGLSSAQVQDMAKDIVPGGSAMLVLFEHLWAVKLREAVANAGGEAVAQGMLNPTALAVGGTTLAEAVAAAEKIEAAAEEKAAEETAKAEQTLADAEAQAAEKQAETQRILDETEAASQTKMREAEVIAAATIAASARMASEKMDEAEKAQAEAQAQLAATQAQLEEAQAKLAEAQAKLAEVQAAQAQAEEAASAAAQAAAAVQPIEVSTDDAVMAAARQEIAAKLQAGKQS
jgi:uncharacterized membrane protein